MPWSGSSPNETYSRTDGTRTGTTVWQDAEAAAVNIVSDDHDTHDQDIATAINACLKKDGGNQATADISMGSNNLTNVADPTSDQHAATQIFAEKALGGRATTAKTDSDSPVTIAVADEAKFFTGDCTSGAITFNLPAAASAGDKFTVLICKIDSSSNDITIDGNSSETINGATTYTLDNQWDSVLLRCDGSNWHIAAESDNTTYTIPSGTWADENLGQETIWVPAGAMKARVTTAPATPNSVEIGTSLIALDTMDFATDADDHAGFAVAMPKSWDAGTIFAEFHWSTDGSQTAGLDGVKWFIRAGSYGSNDALTTALGTAVGPAAQDHSATADDIMITAEVELTVANAAAEEWVYFEVYRDVDDPGDDLDIDARLHGVRLHYTIDAGNDS